MGVNTRFGLSLIGNLQGGYGSSQGNAVSVPMQAGIVAGTLDGEVQNLYLNGSHMIAQEASGSSLKVRGIAHAREIEDIINKEGKCVAVAAGISKSGNPNVKVDYTSGDKQHYKATHRATLSGMAMDFPNSKGIFNTNAQQLVQVQTDDSKSSVSMQFTLNYLSSEQKKKSNLLPLSGSIALAGEARVINQSQQALISKAGEGTADRSEHITLFRKLNDETRELIFRTAGSDDVVIQQKLTEIESGSRALVEQLVTPVTTTRQGKEGTGLMYTVENKEKHLKTLQSRLLSGLHPEKSEVSLNRLNSHISSDSGSISLHQHPVSVNRQHAFISGDSAHPLAFYRGGADTPGSSGTPEISGNTFKPPPFFMRMDSRYSEFTNHSESNKQDYSARHENRHVARKIDEMRTLDDAVTADFMGWHVTVDNVQAQATSTLRFQKQPHIMTNTMLVMTQEDRMNFLQEIRYRNHAGFYEHLPGNETFYTSLQQYNSVEFDRSGATHSGRAHLAYNVAPSGPGVYNVAHVSRVTADPY